MNATVDATLPPTVQRWKAHLEGAANASPHTVRDYTFLVRQLYLWLGTRPLTEQSIVDYRRYLQKQRARPLSPPRIRLAFTAIRHYLGWRRKNGETDLPNLAEIDLKLPGIKQTERRSPSTEDVARLFEAAEARPRVTLQERLVATRDLALLACFCNNGLRRAEALGIQRNDIEEDGEKVTIRLRSAKGFLVAEVPVIGKTREYLGAYLDARKAYLAEHGGGEHQALWLVDRSRALGDRGLNAMLQYLITVAGVERYTAHQFRHFFGTSILQFSDIETARRALRHSKVETTARYLHTDDQRVAAAIAAVADRNAGIAPVPPAAANKPVLVECPCCGRQVSIRAAACPGCAEPIAGHVQPPADPKPRPFNAA